MRKRSGRPVTSRVERERRDRDGAGRGGSEARYRRNVYGQSMWLLLNFGRIRRQSLARVFVFVWPTGRRRGLTHTLRVHPYTLPQHSLSVCRPCAAVWRRRPTRRENARGSPIYIYDGVGGVARDFHARLGRLRMCTMYPREIIFYG